MARLQRELKPPHRIVNLPSITLSQVTDNINANLRAYAPDSKKFLDEKLYKTKTQSALQQLHSEQNKITIHIFLTSFRKHAARMVENIFNYLAFQDVTLSKNKMSRTTAYNIQTKKYMNNCYIKMNRRLVYWLGASAW